MASGKLEQRNLGTGVLAATLLCLSLGACALGPGGPGDEAGGAASALSVADHEALPRAAWVAAEAGCEGRLETTEPLRVAFAEGEPDLRVVMLGDFALCVDSASAVAEELSGHVLEVEGPSEQLDARELGTFSFRTSLVSADPSPQPSKGPETGQPSGGVPTPAPGPTEADPSPQPSLGEVVHH